MNIQLRGVITSNKKHRIETTFAGIPDVPVSKFKLTMQGGKKGLLVNSRNLCAKHVLLVPQLQSPERQEAEQEEAAAAGRRLSKVKKHHKKHKAKGKKRSKRSA